MEIKDNKVLFADQLRAVAFISVVIVHWCGVFWIKADIVSLLIHAPAIYGEPTIYNMLVPPVPNFNYGPFGVSIFFLISGFVIPFSLEKKTRRGFLLARFIRIYPTYLVASMIMLCMLWLTSKYYWNKPAEFDIPSIIANLTLTQSIFNKTSIDAVNWTLAIELKFYLTCVIFSRFIIKGRALLPVGLAMFVLILTIVTQHAPNILNLRFVEISLSNIRMELMFIGFMTIGTLFHFHFSGKISTTVLVVSSVLCFLITSLTWKLGPINDQIPEGPFNYAYGLIIFSLCYGLRKHFRESKVMSFFAGISYPFYALHSIIGYMSIRLLLDSSVPFLLSLLITSIVVLTLSFTLHNTIEKYSIKLGKRFK
ncbi:MAG: acyltransferase family protein [Ewingella sp.]|uniref:acyltransferase family protein n=1 Tax=Ewingella sp. TaxID=1897459 RepID=UPI003F936D80